VLLLHNAKRFTIDPRSHQRLPNAQARLIADTSNGYVTFAVEDTGIGVPPEEADHIFEEFVQLDNYFDGMGIGLTVARSLSRRLDGDLTLDTNYKGGARFVLKLPISYTSSIVKSSAVI
jgi:signal transduction histidine kinase